VNITHTAAFIPSSPPAADLAAMTALSASAMPALATGLSRRSKKKGAVVTAGGMAPFTSLTGKAAPLDMANVDTDMIIPKQFLKTITRKGLGVSCFFPLRYDPTDGKPVPSFVLNRPEYADATVLVVGDNFGCGSSREHAPWAIADAGIRCIISTSFADIFFNNCCKNSLLCVALPAEQVRALMADAVAQKSVSVDLAALTVTRANGEVYPFTFDEFRRDCLLNGLDDIGITMKRAAAIDTFEGKRSTEFPWLDGAGYTPQVGKAAAASSLGETEGKAKAKAGAPPSKVISVI